MKTIVIRKAKLIPSTIARTLKALRRVPSLARGIQGRSPYVPYGIVLCGVLCVWGIAVLTTIKDTIEDLIWAYKF